MHRAHPRSTTMDEQTFVPRTMRALYFCPASTAITDPTDPALPRVDSETVFDSDFPTPKPSPNQYLIKVQTAAFSHDELRLAKTLNPSKSIPQVPVHNFCGKIISTPTQDHRKPGGSKFKLDDVVFGLISYRNDGAAADYVVATDNEIAMKPKNISAAEAATIPHPALAAWQALFKYAAIDPNDTSDGGKRRDLRVLITNAQDHEIGAQATRLLRSSLFPHYRPWICGTCPSKAQAALLRQKSDIDEIIVPSLPLLNHREFPKIFHQKGLEPVDIVLDCAGCPIFKEAHSPYVVKDQGTVLTAVDSTPIREDTPDGDAEARERGLFSRLVCVEPDGESLGYIAEMVEKNMVRGRIESITDLVNGTKFLDSDTLLTDDRTKGGMMVFRVDT